MTPAAVASSAEADRQGDRRGTGAGGRRPRPVGRSSLGGRVRPILASASPRGVPSAPSRRRTRPSGATTGLVSSTGSPRSWPMAVALVRRPPTSDPLPLLLQARRHGPLLVVVASVDAAQLLGSPAAIGRAARWRCSRATGRRPAEASTSSSAHGPRCGGRCTGCGAIVVLDEHDEALQEERNPTWHARDVAIERARRSGIACLLVSPARRSSALAWAGAGVRRPSRSEERAGWPVVDIVDRS